MVQIQLVEQIIKGFLCQHLREQQPRFRHTWYTVFQINVTVKHLLY